MKWKDLRKLSEKATHVISNVADVVVHLKTPTVVGLALVAARALNSYREVTNVETEEFFRDWTFLDVSPLDEVAYAIAHRKKLIVTEESVKDKGKIVTATIMGSKMGWIVYDGWKYGPWVPLGTDVEQVRNALAAMVWEDVGNAATIEVDAMGKLQVVPDPLTDVLPSKTAEDLYLQLKRFTDKGYERAVLLYGEAGTGKSQIMRYVANRFGGLTLRLKAKELGNVRKLPAVLKILKPSALLIDDMDRSPSTAIMDEFEAIKASTQIFMVSVNDITKLDPATLRVGRFDVRMELTKLDDEVIEKLLSGVSPAAATRLRNLPVAYIGEFLKIRDVAETEDEIMSEIDALVATNKLVQELVEESKKDVIGDLVADNVVRLKSNKA